MPETAVNEGANWTQQDDGSIWRWDVAANEWLVWTQGAPGPQPPKGWIKRQKKMQAESARKATQAERDVRKQNASSPPLPGDERGQRERRAQPCSRSALPVSATEKALLGGDQVMFGAPTGTRTRDVMETGPLDEIEAEGWRLETAGYVFQPTGSQSRDRLLASGQVETIMGNVLGIYLFRATDTAPSHLPQPPTM
jgi:hypothetical protein